MAWIELQFFFVKYKNIIINILIALWLVFTVRSCMSIKDSRQSLRENLKSLNDSAVYYKDKYGKEHARVNQVELSKKDASILFGKEIERITSELKIKEKQIKYYTSIKKETEGTFESKLDTVWKDSLVYKDGEKVLVPYIEYVGTTYKDKWLDFKGKFTDSSFKANYSISDSLTIVSYWKRKGFLSLGKKELYLDISSSNPNTKIINIDNFKISEEKVKRFGIGPQAGFQFSNGSFNPYIGIGIHYSLFKF